MVENGQLPKVWGGVKKRSKRIKHIGVTPISVHYGRRGLYHGKKKRRETKPGPGFIITTSKEHEQGVEIRFHKG